MIAAIQPPFTYSEDSLVKLRRYPSRFKEAALGTIATIDFFGTLLMMLIVLYKAVLEPLSPLITFAVFAVVTTWACTNRDRTNKMLAFGGIALYLLSWPMTATWGTASGMGVFFLAMVFYFGAIFRAINRNHPASPRAFAQPLHNH